MISNRPNQEIKIVENKPFISRVDPKQRLGLNPVANKQHIAPVKSNQDVLNVLSHHKRWLSQFKQRVKQNQRNSYYQNQVQEQKEHRLRQQSLRNIQINKQKASLINMSEDIIAPEISPNQAQEILGLDENEVENYKKTYNQIQNQEDNYSVGNLGDVNDAQEQQLQVKKLKSSLKNNKNQRGNRQKKNIKKKPEWAMTEDEYNEYVEKKEDDEAEDLLDFVNNLDYENYVDDLEYTQLLGALKTRIEDLTDKNQNQQQQRQKQLKYIQDREYDNQDNQSMQSLQSKSSIASIKENITKKHRIQQDKDWDKSTTNGEKITIEQRLVKHIADEILRNNRFLRNIHSNSSLRALLENEAQRQLKQKEQKQLI